MSALVATMALWLASASAQTARPAVTPEQQAHRDADRVAILHAELEREQRALAEVTQRRAELLAAGDLQAAEEAELARHRASQNIAALHRELQRSGRAAPFTAAPAPSLAPASVPVAAPTVAAAPQATARPGAVWWDVYTRPRLAAAVASEPAQPLRP